jgi:hypothetical protein
MRATTLEKWTWPLIFGGLLLAALGVSIGNSDATFGGWVIAIGLVAAAVGVVLIVLRSRIKDDR